MLKTPQNLIEFHQKRQDGLIWRLAKNSVEERTLKEKLRDNKVESLRFDVWGRRAASVKSESQDKEDTYKQQCQNKEYRERQLMEAQPGTVVL